MTPSWRKPVGVLAVLLGLSAYALLIASQAQHLAALPWPVEALAYLLLGLAWLPPMGPVLRWMETGRWRAGPRHHPRP